MLHHEGGYLTCESVVEDEVTVAHLVEHRDEVALAIGCSLGGLHGAHIGDKAVVAYHIVVDIARDVLNEAVVADGDIAQRCVVHSRMLEESLAHLHTLVKMSEAYVAIEHHAVEIIWCEVFAYFNALPVFRPTAVSLKG